MNPRKIIRLIIIGSLLFNAGGLAAVQLYDFPVLPMITFLMWSSVVTSSLISMTGLIMLIFSLKEFSHIEIYNIYLLFNGLLEF